MPCELDLFVPGKKVEWGYVPRGGYGYTFWIEARIVKLNEARTHAMIEVTKKSGEKVIRRVMTKNLRNVPQL